MTGQDGRVSRAQIAVAQRILRDMDLPDAQCIWPFRLFSCLACTTKNQNNIFKKKPSWESHFKALIRHMPRYILEHYMSCPQAPVQSQLKEILLFLLCYNLQVYVMMEVQFVPPAHFRTLVCCLCAFVPRTSVLPAHWCPALVCIVLQNCSSGAALEVLVLQTVGLWFCSCHWC